ncbi:MAG TPA: creatininase family protein [Longimicrobiales bacterium]|nr:creatininase family protein [Longimicrobiales bacterium]
MRIEDATWMQIEEFLKHDDRCVVPLGSTEQHAYLSLCVDAILAEKVAVDAAAPTGVPVFPVLSYGITPYFMAFPGTVTLSQGTYERVLCEVFGALHVHGFRRFLVVNGHGGNSVARPAMEAWAASHQGVALQWHDWWKAPRTWAAVKAIDQAASHASWMEGFPWTRVATAKPPQTHKPSVDLTGREEMTPQAFRQRLGDGSFGGYYERPDAELLAIWDIAVTETRELLEGGWGA